MKIIKIGLLGFGNVGTGVYQILKKNGKDILHREGLRLEIEKILVKDINRKRKIDVDRSLFTNNIDDIINNKEISIVVELIGGITPAKQYILSALEKGKTIVTANKELMATYWPELERVAQENKVGLYYEASAAGGIPVIRVVEESLQSNNICEIIGIINGTTNYILTKMHEEDRNFENILYDAQQLGYAEADPTADIEAFDAAYKLSILSSIAFHVRVPIEHVYREGITKITAEDIKYGKEFGYAMRLLAIAKKEGSTIEARVHPTFIPTTHPLAIVRGAYNAIFINGDVVGNIMLYGEGAGGLPTGSAIVSDIINACHQQNTRHRYTTFYNKSKVPANVVFKNNWESEFFVRLTVQDEPGVLATISKILASYKISIASMIQKNKNGHHVPLVFITHRTKELSVRKAVNDIAHNDKVITVENIIRVES